MEVSMIKKNKHFIFENLITLSVDPIDKNIFDLFINSLIEERTLIRKEKRIFNIVNRMAFCLNDDIIRVDTKYGLLCRFQSTSTSGFIEDCEFFMSIIFGDGQSEKYVKPKHKHKVDTQSEQFNSAIYSSPSYNKQPELSIDDIYKHPMFPVCVFGV
jgi:hypothetical protein